MTQEPPIFVVHRVLSHVVLSHFTLLGVIPTMPLQRIYFDKYFDICYSYIPSDIYSDIESAIL